MEFSNAKKAFDFTLPDQNGNDFTLSEKVGKYLLLVFYPKDDSLICTKQLCNYNNEFETFIENQISIAAISVDSIKSHNSFAKKHNFQFPILSDESKEISDKYEALNIIGLNKRKLVLVNSNLEILYENSVLPFFYNSADKVISEIKIVIKNNTF